MLQQCLSWGRVQEKGMLMSKVTLLVIAHNGWQHPKVPPQENE